MQRVWYEMQTPVYLSSSLSKAVVLVFPISPSLEAYVFCKFQYLPCLPCSLPFFGNARQSHNTNKSNRFKKKLCEFLKRKFLINVLRKSTNWMQLLVLICSAGVMMSVIKSSSGGSKGSKRSNLTERGKGHKVKCITT